MNKDSVKPADKLLMLSSKVMLDFDTFWILQFGRDQGVPAPLNPLPLEEGKFHFFQSVKFKDLNELLTKFFNFMCGEVK
jgi:hypothetical protein